MDEHIFKKLLAGQDLDTQESQLFMKLYHNLNPNWSEEYFNRPSETGKSSYEILCRSIEGPKILEIGCGNGIAASLVSSLNMSYTGIDIASECIDLAKRRFANNPNCKFFTSAAHMLPFHEASFDGVISHMALSLCKPIDKVIEAIARVLRRGGKLATIVPAVWQKPKVGSEINAVIRESIFSVYPNFSKNAGGFGEREFFSEAGIMNLLESNYLFKNTEITKFEVDFSADINELLWGIKTFYWYQALDEQQKAIVEKDLREKIASISEPNKKIPYSRCFALIVANRS